MFQLAHLTAFVLLLIFVFEYLDKRIRRVSVGGPGYLLFLCVSVKRLADRVLGDGLCLGGDVHHPHVVLFGHSGAGSDGVRITAVAFHR